MTLLAGQILVEIYHASRFVFPMTIVLAKPSEAQVRKEIRAMRRASQKIFTSKKSTRAFLQKHGFITKDNKLGKAYR